MAPSPGSGRRARLRVDPLDSWGPGGPHWVPLRLEGIESPAPLRTRWRPQASVFGGPAAPPRDWLPFVSAPSSTRLAPCRSVIRPARDITRTGYGPHKRRRGEPAGAAPDEPPASVAAARHPVFHLRHEARPSDGTTLLGRGRNERGPTRVRRGCFRPRRNPDPDSGTDLELTEERAGRESESASPANRPFPDLPA